MRHETEKLTRNLHATSMRRCSKQSKQHAESNEMSKLDANKFSRSMNHLALQVSTKINHSEINLASKLNTFENTLTPKW